VGRRLKDADMANPPGIVRRRLLLATALGLVVGGAESARAAFLSEGDAAAGVRMALERGALSAVSLLGRTDGFLGNPQVRIPLPGVLSQAAPMLKMMGQQHLVDDLVTAMNHAAEQAVPQGREVLVNAAKSVSIEDALHIVRGGDTSVTDYFAGKTRQPLHQRFLPIVTATTKRVALAQKYDALAGKAAGMGLLKGDETNVESYVTGKTLDGLYRMIGEEEKKIRRDPVGTGSAILRKVFGG
jgi:hypothetical protein